MGAGQTPSLLPNDPSKFVAPPVAPANPPAGVTPLTQKDNPLLKKMPTPLSSDQAKTSDQAKSKSTISFWDKIITFGDSIGNSLKTMTRKSYKEALVRIFSNKQPQQSTNKSQYNLEDRLNELEKNWKIKDANQVIETLQTNLSEETIKNLTPEQIELLQSEIGQSLLKMDEELQQKFNALHPAGTIVNEKINQILQKQPKREPINPISILEAAKSEKIPFTTDNLKLLLQPKTMSSKEAEALLKEQECVFRTYKDGNGDEVIELNYRRNKKNEEGIIVETFPGRKSISGKIVSNPDPDQLITFLKNHTEDWESKAEYILNELVVDETPQQFKNKYLPHTPEERRKWSELQVQKFTGENLELGPEIVSMTDTLIREFAAPVLYKLRRDDNTAYRRLLENVDAVAVFNNPSYNTPSYHININISAFEYDFGGYIKIPKK